MSYRRSFTSPTGTFTYTYSGGVICRSRCNFRVRACAGEAGCHAGASPAGRIGLFHDRKPGQGRSREAEPESTTRSELSGRNDSEPHRMSLETENREPSRYLNGEGCHASLSNSQAAAQHLRGVSAG